MKKCLADSNNFKSKNKQRSLLEDGGAGSFVDMQDGRVT